MQSTNATLIVSNSSYTSITVKLKGLDTSYSGKRTYKWKYKKSSSNSWILHDTNESNTAISQKTHKFTGLSSGTEYDFQVIVGWWTDNGNGEEATPWDTSCSGSTEEYTSSGGGSEEEESCIYYYKYYDIYTKTWLTSTQSTLSSSITAPDKTSQGYTYLGYVYHSSFDECLAWYKKSGVDGTGRICNSHTTGLPYIVFFYSSSASGLGPWSFSGAYWVTDHLYITESESGTSSLRPFKIDWIYLQPDVHGQFTITITADKNLVLYGGPASDIDLYDPPIYNSNLITGAKIANNSTNGGTETLTFTLSPDDHYDVGWYEWEGQSCQVDWEVVFTPGYVITYDGNAKDSYNLPSSQSFQKNSSVTISSIIPARLNYRFLGWSTDASATTPQYLPNSTYVFGASNITLYAIWGPDQVQLTYDANGGSTPPNPIDIPIEQPYELSESLLIKNGYVFKGWSLNKNDTKAKIYLPGESIIISEATTIYAVWWPDFNWLESYLHLSDANTLSTYIHDYIDSSMTDYTLPIENVITHNWYNKLANIINITNVSAKDVITKNVLNFLSDGYKNFNQKWKNFSIFKKSPTLLCNCINYRVPGLVKDTTTNNLITVGSQGSIYRQPYAFNENLVQINKSVLTDPSSRLFNNPSCIEFDENYNRVVIGYNNNSLDFEKERYVDFYNPNAGVFNAAKTVSSQLYNCNGLSKLNSGHVIFCGESKDSASARIGYMSSSFAPQVTNVTPASQASSICSATCFDNSPIWLTKEGRIQYASFTDNGTYVSHVEGILLTTDSSNIGKKIYNINNNVVAACLFNSTTSLYTIYYKENQTISDTIVDDYQTITLNKFPTAIIFYNQSYLIFYEDGSMEIRDTLQMATGLKTNLIQGYANALVKDVRIIDNRLFITIWHGDSQKNSAIFYYNLS